MAPQTSKAPTGANGGALGCGHLLGGDDTSEYNPSATRDQELSRLREQLAIKRESTWNVGDTASIHLDLALGCLRVADDDGLVHHVERVVNAVRAFARLTNEITEIRNGVAR